MNKYVANINNNSKKKAELINHNKIYIPKNLRLPYPLDRSTTGPGSGSLFIALTFDNKNIKLAVSKNCNEIFSLQKENDQFKILKEGDIFLDNVEIIPILFHAPGQAFINIDDRCIYNCTFCNCNTKNKKYGFLQNYDKQRFVELILKISNRNDFKAVALTGGIYPNNSEVIKKMCYIVKNIRTKLPCTPIGVEPYIKKTNEIKSLKESGANEIKINLQIPDEYLFRKICPDFDYSHIINMLETAVDIFGQGKVTSNILYGLGESDETVIKSVEKLAEMGVVPTLRKIRLNNFIREKLKATLNYKMPFISTDRIIKLAYEQKNILEKYGLTTKTFKTMCHKCGCCDIVPFWDI